MILEILLSITALAISIIVHELGHFVYLHCFTAHWERNIKFSWKLNKFGWIYYPSFLSKKQEANMLLVGIFSGYTFILVAMLTLAEIAPVYMLLAVIFYLVGCTADVKKYGRIKDELERGV